MKLEGNTLVIAPHCDDAEFGCGALLSYLDAQKQIGVAFVSDVKMNHLPNVVDAHTRKQEQLHAARLMGVGTVRFGDADWEENNTNLIPMGDVVGWVEKLIREFEPSNLFIPLPSLNQDHRVLYEACLAASRPSVQRKIAFNLLAYEYQLSFATEGSPAFGRMYFPFNSSLKRKKVSAIKAHASQIVGREDSLEGIDGILTLNKLRGQEIGEEYAELFYVIRAML